MDPAALRAALEQQQSELAPIGRVLAAMAAFPPRLRADDWRGEAADAAERSEDRLRQQLRDADGALGAAERATRAALRESGG